MKIEFIDLYLKIADTAKKDLIICGLGSNSDIFREIKKSVHSVMKIPGFKNASSVTFPSHKILVEPLFKKKLYVDNNVARLIFKGYFLKKTKSFQIITEYLKERGYDITEPDFDNDELSYKLLQEEDIFRTEDEVSFFRPNGIKIDGMDDEEATILAVLLGWSVTSSERPEETESEGDDNGDTIQMPEEPESIVNVDGNITEKPEEPELIEDGDIIATENITDKDKEAEVTDKKNNEGTEEGTYNDFEFRLTQLHQDYLETSFLLLEIVEALNNGKIPKEYGNIFEIKALENRFIELKKEIEIHESLNINSIQELRDAYQEIQRENNFLSELINKAQSTLFTYKTIYHIKGESFPFFNELNSLAELYEKEINEQDTVFSTEWFKKLTEETHFYTYFIMAVKHRLIDNYDEDVLDDILDKLEKESELNGFAFFKTLSRQINRGNFNFKNENTPEPPNQTDNERKENLKQHVAKEESKINDAPQEFDDAVTEDKTEPISSEEEINEAKPDESIDLDNKIDNEIQVADADITFKDSEQVIEQIKGSEIKENEALNKQASQKTFITKDSKPQELTISKEDSDILKLLERDEPELAYHLALCFEADDKELFLSSPLLHNLVISNEIRSSTGSIAQKIADNIERYDLHLEETDKWQFKNQLIFASILRPCFIAYETSGAGYMLNEIQSGRFSEFTVIKSLISELMTLTGGVLNFESLLQIWGESDLKQKREKYKSNLESWLSNAQNKSYKNSPNSYFSIVFNNWVKKGGWICDALNTTIQDGKPEDFILLIGILEDNLWKKRRDKELKIVYELKKSGSGTFKSFLEEKDAINWYTNNINELKELLKEGLVYFSPINYTKNNQLHDFNLPEFVGTITNEFERIGSLLNSSKGENVFYNISYRYVIKAIENVKKILNGVEPLGETANIDKLINLPLQKLYCYESEIDWSPKFHNDNLIGEILKFTNQTKSDILEIVATHTDSGNYEALNRLRKVYDIEDVLISVSKDEKYFTDKNKFDVTKTIAEVEKGCAYGYILNGHRSALISSIDEISKRHNNSDGINYPLTKLHLEKIILKIEFEKNRLTKDYINNIPNNILPEYRQKLNKYLENGNLLVFNDILDRMKTNQYVISEDSDDLLSDFFQNFLSNKEGADINSISNALKTGSSHLGIDFSKISINQRSEIDRILKTWTLIKNIKTLNVDETFLHLNSILENLGFISAKMEKHGVFGKSTYFDFTCSPISGKDRTPIPQFGSVAQGKYRIACIRDRLNEEDLIQIIDKVTTPDTNRALLVFYFVWMDQQNRIELSKLSKRKRLTYLLLDEAILVYLVVSNKSKFPLLVQLAAPLAFAEPYQTASSNLPEEMFYGRGPQIQKLKNINGDFSCLIYGGRQLGKTVLQREVERIFHNPEMQHYAIYIDLRSYGIGVWNQKEKIAYAIYESLKNIPELFSEKPQSNFGLPYVISKIKEWLGRNEESRIILFLDESDKFLKQDSLKEWPHLWPLKGLMDDTKNRFKLILAGLHDVRRTINIPNNPLAHFGTPICVGSMLEKDESLEAQRLIKIPLETLGYKFQSEDQVFMILSHCNWYPSLIQIFCSSLLKIMNDKKIIKQFPVLITDNDVTNAYKNSSELIKEKFHLTLGLDERYDLLANLIAGETFENPLVQSQGISVDDITYLATIQWSSGFDSSNTKVQVTNFLNEMVDLGILRNESSGMYALRTPNLLGLIGTEKQIAENINKVRLHSEYDREFFRIMYQKGNREQRSPLPVSYYDKIVDPELKVLVFRSSIMGGINYIGEFLKSRSKEINLILPEFQFNDLNSVDEFWISIEKRRPSNKRTVILFDSNYSYTIENIMTIKERIGKKSITAVFLMDSPMIWDIISQFDKSFILLENESIPVINLPIWREDVIKEWFTETGCITAKISEITGLIGEWHHLLDKYHASIAEHPEMWKEKLIDFESEILSNKPDIYKELGISSPRMIELLKELINWNGEISEHDFVELYSTDSKLLEASYFLEYFSCLNLINNELIVNFFVKKVLEHE